MSLLDSVKSVLFAETSDPGKVSQITWITPTHAAVTLHVPAAAYERYASRATLRAAQIKIPNAHKVHIIRHQYCIVREPSKSYYLVRAEIKTK